MKSARCAGFTLAELLVVVAVIAITARIVVPTLSFAGANALSLAASETGNALRLARDEAVRSGRPVLVDADSAAGRIRLWYADCTAAGPFPAVLDPATRRAADIAVAEGGLAGPVAMTATFSVAGGGSWSGLVFDASGAASQVCDTATTTAKGVPQAGSGITLGTGGGSAVVTVDPPTGRISWP